MIVGGSIRLKCRSLHLQIIYIIDVHPPTAAPSNSKCSQEPIKPSKNSLVGAWKHHYCHYLSALQQCSRLNSPVHLTWAASATVSMAFQQYLFFWNSKTRSDNDWHPQIGQCPTKYTKNLPHILQRADIEATLVDAAPFVASIGAIRHASQLFDFGFTAPASIPRNVKTMTAIHRSVLLSVPLVLFMQISGIQYRTLIPRWCHERERHRDEATVRRHVDVGAYIGSVSWVARMMLKVGVRYWAPIEVVLGGALSDVLHREYIRTHSS